jgi:protein-L-isoaspartate O-methyltransferase
MFLLLFFHYYLIINSLFLVTESFTKRIYEYKQYKVDDVEHALRGIDRLFGTNDFGSSSKILAHGFINLNNIDLVIMPHIQSVMGALFLFPIDKKPQRILVIGLGIGVLPRALNRLLKDSYIDAVEIDSVIFDIARDYFFLQTSSHLNVHIEDGHEYIMNLKGNQTYDLIVLDAFSDLTEETCAPESFLSEKFILKVKEHLNANGVIAINSLPSLCPKHIFERNIYHKIFGKLYISTHGTDRCFLGLKNSKNLPSKRLIKERVKYYKKSFTTIGVDSMKIFNIFQKFKRFRSVPTANHVCLVLNYIFINNICLI